MEIIEQITNIFQEKFGQTPAHIGRAPGRVNLLGEHVDYNDGFVLPAAIDRATYIAFSPTHFASHYACSCGFQRTGFIFPAERFRQKPKRIPLPCLNGHIIRQA